MAFKKRQKKTKAVGKVCRIEEDQKYIWGQNHLEIEKSVIELQKQSFFQVGANVGYEER